MWEEVTKGRGVWEEVTEDDVCSVCVWGRGNRGRGRFGVGVWWGRGGGNRGTMSVRCGCGGDVTEGRDRFGAGVGMR